MDLILIIGSDLKYLNFQQSFRSPHEYHPLNMLQSCPYHFPSLIHTTLIDLSSHPFESTTTLRRFAAPQHWLIHQIQSLFRAPLVTQSLLRSRTRDLYGAAASPAPLRRDVGNLLRPAMSQSRRTQPRSLLQPYVSTFQLPTAKWSRLSAEEAPSVPLVRKRAQNPFGPSGSIPACSSHPPAPLDFGPCRAAPFLLSKLT